MSEKTAEVQEKVQTVADESSPKGGDKGISEDEARKARGARPDREIRICVGHGNFLPVPRLLDGVYGLQDADGNLCAAPAPDSTKPNPGLV